MATTLRPIERRVLALRAAGLDYDDIARRFRRSPEHIARVVELASLDRTPRPVERDQPLRPLERLVLRWRDQGVSYSELGERFRRGADHMRRIEELARYKLGRQTS